MNEWCEGTVLLTAVACPDAVPTPIRLVRAPTVPLDALLLPVTYWFG
ncbi:MAG TPA: hypothetical protein VFB56_11120 [Nitrospiraceae bacterium]|jgi:hypothetical protein|nr:hypothetical protein [Nitrospiraceae bacterium]